MEWVVVVVVVVVALVAGVIMRRRALEAEAHAPKTPGAEDGTDEDPR